MTQPLSPEEAMAKTWTVAEIAAYMLLYGPPAPGQIVKCNDPKEGD